MKMDRIDKIIIENATYLEAFDECTTEQEMELNRRCEEFGAGEEKYYEEAYQKIRDDLYLRWRFM